MLHNPNLNSLMRGRLGLYSLQPGQDAGVEDRKEQFKQQGGYHQQERMIKDKLKSLEKACLYSYQAGEVRDINAKVLKVVGDTDKKLREDKTRIIRAIRFACTLDLDLSAEILDFISSKRVHLVNEIPGEYKKDELDKIIAELESDFYE